ncbi:general transcription factor II-I repeat domain-containing protein 2B-like [Ornithodoros turicata]|uniref:general transcription factor II-I repeat domain-containing protein 2B-like n=1 Tax=Ornithodoros turicata TaxID=34597 RepID=UPI003139C2B1
MAEPEWFRDLAFHVDLTNHLNILNMGLQGNARLITEMYDSVRGFVRKLELWEKQLTSKDFFHFHGLKAVDCKNEETLLLREDVKPELQMKLIDLQCNFTLRQKFGEIGAPEFYKYAGRKSFPCLMSDVSRVLSMLGSTHVCEQFFSINKTKLMSELSDDHLRAQLRIANAVNLQVDLGNLVRKKRPQVSLAHH